MVGSNSNFILIDFGSVTIARQHIEDHQQLLNLIEDSEIKCTPSFRAPELWDRGSVDPIDIDERTDIWALGCLLYTVMFGVNPFDLAVLQGANLKLSIIEAKFEFSNEYHYPNELCELITYILDPNEKNRPFISQVIERIQKIIHNLN